MKSLRDRLDIIEKRICNDDITIMIIGLGSVGTYLLNYLISRNDPAIRIVAVGRDYAKMESKVNISRIAGLIRNENKSEIIIEGGVDLADIDQIRFAIEKYDPAFIINSSRAYAGLKYGSISWHNVRAYGIWTPLSIKYTKNIMQAADEADTNAVVINTSYSDAVIPWLRSAGKAYPDFGSGNINHLIPRMKYAVADILGIKDFWNVDIMLACSHFHDVVISKEGQSEGQKLLLKAFYNGKELDVKQEDILSRCSIPMPTDATRNMMNASSNYQIIDAFIRAVRTGEDQRVFSPGVFGEVGGYPVTVGYRDGRLDAYIDESVYSVEEMRKANKDSIYLDGVEGIADGCLIYTDELIEKAKQAFNTELPKKVAFNDIETVAQFIIDNIILPQTEK